MLNYLERRDLERRRVEARRLAVMQKYVADDLHERDNAVLGLGRVPRRVRRSRRATSPDEALRWYDEALAFTGFQALRGPGARAARSRRRTARRG